MQTLVFRTAFLLLLVGALVPEGNAQQRLVLFDEDSSGLGYHEASLGLAAGGDALWLAGPEQNRMPVVRGSASAGAAHGVLAYRHRSGGSWELQLGADGWPSLRLVGADSLVFYLNGPASVPAAELPQVQLLDHAGETSLRLRLSAYLAGLDADTTTWQRVSIPTPAFLVLGRFDPDDFRAVRFAAGDPGPEPRTLWIDDVFFVQGTPPATPVDLTATAGDMRVVLRWRAGLQEPLGGFRVYRSQQPGSGFAPVGEAPDDARLFVDETVTEEVPYYYQLRALSPSGLESEASAVVSATPQRASRADFLDEVQRLAFDYFWHEANPSNGLVKDRSTPGSPASIAAVGFGLSALTVGVDHGWITREQGRDRTLATLRFFWNAPQGTAPDATGYKGFFYHFLDMQTGRRAWDSELSTIDTALLLGGVLHARQYFDGSDATEAEIRALADSIYHRVDWPWAQARPPYVSMGWMPESGFLAHDWHGYNEAMILYILALGSPTHPVGPEAWEAWTAGYEDQWQTHYGYTFLTFPPLFGHQYSHVWIDFRGIQDAFMRSKGIDYFENSRRATLAQQAYAIQSGYSENEWGWTASDGPTGYRARGVPPLQNMDGTISPTAAGGSYAFTPDASFEALRFMYDVYRSGLWGPYGFRDAYNVRRNWFATDYLGIDQGPILLMIENGETGRIWDVFMQHEAVQRGLERAGFTAVNVAAKPEAGLPETLVLEGSHPNPFSRSAEVRYGLARPGAVTLAVYDVLGRQVALLVDGVRQAGRHAAVFDAAGLPGGVYVYVLRQDAAVRTGTMVLLR